MERAVRNRRGSQIIEVESAYARGTSSWRLAHGGEAILLDNMSDRGCAPRGQSAARKP